MTGLGRTVGSALTNAIPALGRFRDGWVNTDAAASAFSGRMGTLGGLARTALTPGITGVQNLVAGFLDARAATSAFTGNLGTIGGALRRVADAGISTVSTLGSSFAAFSSRAAADVKSKLGAAFEHVKGMALTTLSAVGIGGIGALVGSGIKRISDIEQTTKALGVLTGSAEKAKLMMDDLLTFAKTTPFSFPDIATIGKNLIAFGVDTAKVIPALKALGDAAAASGKGAAGLAQLGTILGQVAAKGKIQGDEILQFAEAGVPALQILANTAGVTSAEMSKRISAGAVDSKFALDALITGIENGTNGLAGQTAKFGGIMLDQKDTLVGALDLMRSAVTSSMATLLEPLVPAMRAGMARVGEAFKALPGIVAETKNLIIQIGLADAFGGLFESVRNLAINAWPLIKAFATGFVAAFGPSVTLLINALGTALGWVADALRGLQPVLTPLVAALGALWGITTAVRLATMAWGAAVLIGQGIVRAMTVVTAAWRVGMTVLQGVILAVRAAQWLLNAAWAASPVGVIIVAITALVAAFVWLWNNSEGFRNFWIGLWNGIQNVAVSVYNGFLRPMFDGIVTAVRAVGAAASWLWANVLSPVFNAIGLAARVLIAIIVTVLVTPFVIAFRALAEVATWLWTNAISPVFSWIAAGATWLWINAIRPVIDLIVAAFRFWSSVALWLWTNGIKPAIDAIGAAATWLWTNAISPAVDFIVGGFRQLGDWATWLYQKAIKPAWDAIGAAISWVWSNVVSPAFGALRVALDAVGAAFTWIYRHVIEPAWRGVGSAVRWVYDNAIVPAFDAVKGAVHSVGEAFDAAVTWIGQIWDKIKGIAAAPVNFVIEWVYNRGIRAVWNWVADFLGLGKLAEATPIQFAGGGIIPGFAPGRDDVPALLSRGESVLTPEATRLVGAENVLALNAAASGRPATVVGRNGYSGGGVARFAGGGVIDTILSFVGGIADTVVALFKDPIGWVKSRIGFPDAPWITMLAKMPAELIGKAVDWLWSKLNPFSSSEEGAPTVGGDLLGWIRAAMTFTGVPANWEGPLQTLIMRESGGNPRAINLTDINARRGDPSRGLMQTIGATFAAYRDPRLSADIYDPIANIVAGINYIKARYGTIFNVQQAVGATPKGYDQGGWLPPGLSTVYNGTGKPEAVFTRKQYDAIVGRIRSAENMRPITVYARTDADPEHIAHVIDRHLALGARL
ncbi:tape measure protein [Amycolatopsis taiwanensis]|uniref:tape measure protein n=1 Tax=Amycolatopsis taiwanensis TaxID=342230 RepID=UPI0012EBB0BD|nr:tape measure protein [Amycolatopsis taiwanensis]